MHVPRSEALRRSADGAGAPPRRVLAVDGRAGASCRSRAGDDGVAAIHMPAALFAVLRYQALPTPRARDGPDTAKVVRDW